MKASILSKLDLLAERYEEVGALLSDAEIISDQNKYRELSKEYAELEPVVKSYQSFLEVASDIDEAKLLLKDSDPDMRAMANDEVQDGQAQLEVAGSRLAALTIAQGPQRREKCIFRNSRRNRGRRSGYFLRRLVSHVQQVCRVKPLES